MSLEAREHVVQMDSKLHRMLSLFLRTVICSWQWSPLLSQGFPPGETDIIMGLQLPCQIPHLETPEILSQGEKRDVSAHDDVKCEQRLALARYKTVRVIKQMLRAHGWSTKLGHLYLMCIFETKDILETLQKCIVKFISVKIFDDLVCESIS